MGPAIDDENDAASALGEGVGRGLEGCLGVRVEVRVDGGCGAACGVGAEGRMAWIRAVRCIDRDDTTTGSGPVANDADLTCSATARLVSALPALDALIPPSALRPVKPAT